MKKISYLFISLLFFSCKPKTTIENNDPLIIEKDTTVQIKPIARTAVNCYNIPDENTIEIVLGGVEASDLNNSSLDFLISKLTKDSMELTKNYNIDFKYLFVACKLNEMIDLKGVKVNHLYVKQTISANWHPDFDVYEFSFESNELASIAKDKIQAMIQEGSIMNEKPPQFITKRNNKVFYFRTRAFAFMDLVGKYISFIENN